MRIFLAFQPLKRLHVACILPNTFVKKSVTERLEWYMINSVFGWTRVEPRLPIFVLPPPPPSPSEFQPGFGPPTCSLRGFSNRLVAPSALYLVRSGRPSGPFLRFSWFHYSSLCSGSPQISLIPSVSLLFISFLFRSPKYFFQIFFCAILLVCGSFFLLFFCIQPLREFSCADPFNVPTLHWIFDVVS